MHATRAGKPDSETVVRVPNGIISWKGGPVLRLRNDRTTYER